jgi:hypothetical protein
MSRGTKTPLLKHLNLDDLDRSQIDATRNDFSKPIDKTGFMNGLVFRTTTKYDSPHDER